MVKQNMEPTSMIWREYHQRKLLLITGGMVLFKNIVMGNKVQDILRNYVIKDWQSEPHHQHQNAAERRYQDAKRMANTLLDRTGAPPSLWFLALSYVCMILNHTANASIGYAIPMQVLTGVTPDTSSLLQFDWYEPVYCNTE